LRGRGEHLFYHGRLPSHTRPSYRECRGYQAHRALQVIEHFAIGEISPTDNPHKVFGASILTMAVRLHSSSCVKINVENPMQRKQWLNEPNVSRNGG
jgi:hypothetical protein